LTGELPRLGSLGGCGTWLFYGKFWSGSMLKLSNLDVIRRYYGTASNQSEQSDFLSDQQQQIDAFQRDDSLPANAASSWVLAPSTAATASDLWLSEGPTTGASQINGAIQALAVHPTDPNIMYIGAVNGGIWKTTNATAASPHWTPLTDNLPSLSIGALEFDPTDPTHQTLIAGLGATSSFGAVHDALNGVLRSTDGGTTWSQLGTTALARDNFTSVAARGATLLAAAESNWGFSAVNGLFRSTNSGANWTLISDGAHGLPNGASVSDVVGDPLNSTVLYAAVTGASGGIFKSTDTGLTWTNITAGIGIISSATRKIELAVHHDAANLDVFAAVSNNNGLMGNANATPLSGVFRSVNGGSFLALDLPASGTQGELHGAIAADPNNANIVYVGLGGGSSHYLTRIDASKPSGSQITDLSGGTFGFPHVDTREMQVDANGNLIMSSDGGLFRLPTPTGNTGTWSAIAGDMSVFEFHDIAYDHVSHVIMAGAQDNGTLFQHTPGSTTWDSAFGGDGGDVVIDDVSLAGSGQSIRYVSAQNLIGWTRQVYDSANHLVSSTALSAAPPPAGSDDNEDGESAISDPQFSTPVELNNVDPTRLLVGGSGHIYQSLDRGTSLTAIANVGANGFFGGGTMVYGGIQGGVSNPDLVYAASGSNVLRQTAAGGGFTSTTPGGAFIRGVTDNPTNWSTVFAIDDDQVFESTNAGATWVDVTHNLTAVSAADFHSIEYVHGVTDDALVVGTTSGVFEAKLPGLGGTTPWSKVGGNLPDVMAYDLEYDAADNVLVAGTMGRGAWLVNNATSNLGLDNAPEIAVSGNAVNIVDGDTTPSTSDGTDFGTVAQGATDDRVFTVNNTGTSALTTSALTLPSGFTLIEGLSASIAAGGLDTFTVRLDTSSPGTRSGQISFADNDGDENPFNFSITGTVTPPFVPEIAVSGNGVNIVDGDTTPSTSDSTDFGTVAQGATDDRVFTVSNSGTTALTTSGLTLPSGFALIEGLSASIAAGSSDTFTVRLDTSSPGTHSGQISFVNDDSDENPFNFSITGTVSGNHAPVANNDSYSTAENTALTIGSPGVLANDTDLDGDSLTVASYIAPAHGTLAIFTDGSFTYTPSSGYVGADSFSYSASDGSLSSTSPATVSITVNAPISAQVHANDLTYSSTASGFNHFIDLYNFEASYTDLIHAFGVNQAAMQGWYNANEPSERRIETFDGLDYIASYGDLINAFRSAGSLRAIQDDGAVHFITNGLAEGRTTTFNGLDYIASHSDLIAAFGANNDAGAFHYIEYGQSEARTTTFDGLDYIASYSDLIGAFGANEQAGAAHFITNGFSEGRSTTAFDGLSYIAQYTDLMNAFGANNDAGASHYITNGFSEGRSTSFDVAGYEAAHPDLQGRFATNDQFLSAYINTYVTTGHFLT
jgi:hypothetical protein